LRRTTCVLMAAVVCLLIAAEAPVHAYLDPGAGSMLVQVLLGGAAALGVVLRLFWRNLTQPFRKRDASDKESIRSAERTTRLRASSPDRFEIPPPAFFSTQGRFSGASRPTRSATGKRSRPPGSSRSTPRPAA